MHEMGAGRHWQLLLQLVHDFRELRPQSEIELLCKELPPQHALRLLLEMSAMRVHFALSEITCLPVVELEHVPMRSEVLFQFRQSNIHSHE